MADELDTLSPNQSKQRHSVPSAEPPPPYFDDEESQADWYESGIYGLSELWPGDREVETELDIIAVHGLNGDAYRTWTENGKLWLRDFLPQAIPQARVFTYGYNSSIAFTGSASRLDDYARILLERLRGRRRAFSENVSLLERLKGRRRAFSENVSRPLIFVCHSLGGIVVKKAFILAYEGSERYSSILKDTFGIMFLGTPHQGSGVAFWGHCLGSIVDVAQVGSIGTSLLQDMHLKSETLSMICSQFLERSRSLRIFSIYERLKIRGMTELVVDKGAAVMNLPNEVTLPMEADHRSMCRFTDPSSDRYQMVLDCLKEMIEDSLQVEQIYEFPLRADFLHSLNTEDPETLVRRLPRPTQGTCEWVLRTDEYMSWRYGRQSKVLWIWGPPGIGKTTILRNMMETLRRSLQRDDNGTKTRSIVAFCFLGNNHWRLRNEQDALSSLIHQILSFDESSFRYIKEKDVRDFIDEETDDPIRLLRSILLTILKRSGHAQFWLVLDAIDEFADDSKRDLLGMIDTIVDEDLGNKVHFLISDRTSHPRLVLQTQVASIRIQDRQAVLDDVHRFISTNVGNLCSEGMIPWRYQTQIEDTLFTVSENNFLQASLAWTNFTSGVTYWSPQVISKRLEVVRKISQEAEAYYCSLLARIPKDSQDLARVGFTWVLGARKPLSVTELQHAVAISGSQESWADLTEALGFNFEVQFDKAFGYLLNTDSDRQVRFSHQTVKELLTSPVVTALEDRKELLTRFHIESSDIDAELAKACMVVLSYRDFFRLRDVAREALSGHMQDIMTNSWRSGLDAGDIEFDKYDDADDHQLPPEDIPVRELKRTLSTTSLSNSGRTLLSYCVAYWNYHCVEGASNTDVVQSLSEFVMLRQSHFFYLVAMLFGIAKAHKGLFWLKVNQLARLPPLHFLMRIGDHPAVVKNLLSKQQSMKSVDCNGFDALTWAALEERHDSIDVFLSHIHAPLSSSSSSSSKKDSDGILHTCCRAGVSSKVLHRLLEDPRTDINARSSDGWTVLHWCISRQELKTVARSLLARRDLDINAVDRLGRGYLSQAFHDGLSEDLVLQLVARYDVPANWFELEFKGSDSDDMGLEPKTYLDMVTFLQWYAVEDSILVRDPSQVFKIGYSGLTLLEHYASNGLQQRLNQVLHVLPEEIFLSRPSNESNKLLLLCAQQDWPSIISTLRLSHMIDDHGRDSSGRTLAHWASELQWDSVQVILHGKSSLWLDIIDKDGRSALHIAAEHRNETACRALLSAGADWRLRDKYRRLPVHIAAEEGHRSIVSLLLRLSMSSSEKDLEKRQLLHYLVMWHSAVFLRQCLRLLNLELDVFDRRHRTPLHYAAIYDNTGAVRVLLDMGASADIKDASGFTPIHYALTNGSLLNVQQLLDAKANLYTLDKFQRSSLQLAIQSENPVLINFVLRRMALDKKDLRGAVNHADMFGSTALHRLGAWDTRFAQAEDEAEEDTAFLLGLGLDNAVLGDLVVERRVNLDSTTVRRYANILITLGAQSSAQDKQGRTPLHIAIQNGSYIAADAFLAIPEVQLSLEDNTGCTVLDHAANDCQERIADLLKASGASHSLDWRSKIRPLYAPWQDDVDETLDPNVLGQAEWLMVPIS